MSLWKVIRSTNTLQNYGEDPALYTARASYIDVENSKRITRGVLLDIDRTDTILKSCCGATCGSLCGITPQTVVFFHIVNVIGMVCSILSLNGFGNVYLSVMISLLWLCGPLHLVCNANRKILRRQMRYSGTPWFHLYLSAAQTWALMDLFDYDAPKLLMTVPPLLTGLITLTISDAVYILESERSSARIDVLVAFIWQIILAVGVRYNLFDGMEARGLVKTMQVDNTTDVLFQNSSMFCGKSMSIVMMLLSQLVFRIRHPEQAFSLRAHYSVLSNAEWAKKEARHRVYKRKTLEKDVASTRNLLVSKGMASPRAVFLKAEIEEEF